MGVKTLSEVVKFDNNFKTAINLYLSLNKKDKVLSYIPTKSSLNLLDDYMQSVLKNKEHATLMVGPYGKGKSHLLLVLLAVLSMERSEENYAVIEKLLHKVEMVDKIGEQTARDIRRIWAEHRYLPVIVNTVSSDVKQAFLVALNDALRREGLIDIVPETFFSEALKRIDDWEENYIETYQLFLQEISKSGFDIRSIKAGLKQFSNDTMNVFKEIYPKLTAGSSFNPLMDSDVITLYKSVSEKLAEDKGYQGIYIIFDEFSKFIEGLDGSHTGNVMKLIQDMCELSSDSGSSNIYFTMVAHKSIKEYGRNLSQEIINAFTGIEGRIVEKYFITSSKNNYELIKNAIIKDDRLVEEIPELQTYFGEDTWNKYYQLPAFKSNFSESDFKSIIFKGCYPLNPIAAYLLMNTSEKIAQNERTLFTFISNDEPHSMPRFIQNHEPDDGWQIDADLIYDYFSGLFKKDVTNELIHSIWLSAEYALTKCETEDEKKLVKSLAIIMIVNKGDELPANEKYLTLAASLSNGGEVIDSLVKKQVIYKKGSISAYIFKTRAGTELKSAMKKRRLLLDDSKVKYAQVLQKITNKNFIVPRKYNSEKMMTRYFSHEYMDVETFMAINSGEVFWNDSMVGDGKVLTLFSFSDIDIDNVKEHFKQINRPQVIIVIPSKPLTNVKHLKDYEILQDIRKDQNFISGNEVLIKEIALLEEDLEKEIEDTLSVIYAEDSASVFYSLNGDIQVSQVGKEERIVGVICDVIYAKTVVINNEIINRSTITTAQTRKARLNIIEALLSHTNDETFYGGSNQEATIYRSLICRTKLDVGEADENLNEIISIMNSFIDNCCDKKCSLTELVAKLCAAPYGMRLGVVPVYLAYVFALRREDLIVYYANAEVQLTPEIVVNMCESPDAYALYVSKENFEKETYLDNLNKLFAVADNRALTENRLTNIVICMQRWFRGLPQVTRNLSGIEVYTESDELKKSMKGLKKILQRVEFNPYEVLFVDIVKATKVENLEQVYERIESCKSAFDCYYEWTLKRTTKAVYEVFGAKREEDLFHLLKEWYENQSDYSKKGLHNGGITNFLSCIEKLDVNTDSEDGAIVQKLVKAVTNIYLENWIDKAFEEFINSLQALKTEIEQIEEEKTEGKFTLSFTGSTGKKIEHYYEKVDEGTGNILRNVMEETLEDFEDLSVNDRVGILLEMIEKIIG